MSAGRAIFVRFQVNPLGIKLPKELDVLEPTELGSVELIVLSPRETHWSNISLLATIAAGHLIPRVMD